LAGCSLSLWPMMRTGKQRGTRLCRCISIA